MIERINVGENRGSSNKRWSSVSLKKLTFNIMIYINKFLRSTSDSVNLILSVWNSSRCFGKTRQKMDGESMLKIQ